MRASFNEDGKKIEPMNGRNSLVTRVSCIDGFTNYTKSPPSSPNFTTTLMAKTDYAEDRLQFTQRSCLYVKNGDIVPTALLTELIKRSSIMICKPFI